MACPHGTPVDGLCVKCAIEAHETKYVYVAAPYEDAAHVRALHIRLETMGLRHTSLWADMAKGAEDLHKHSPARLRLAAESNDIDVARSDVVLALARKGAGGEMFSEIRYALELLIPVLWVGRHTLSAFRKGVTRCESLDQAMGLLERK